MQPAAGRNVIATERPLDDHHGVMPVELRKNVGVKGQAVEGRVNQKSSLFRATKIYG
jgi:hypothetical protein